jgi:hypothetical protein
VLSRFFFRLAVSLAALLIAVIATVTAISYFAYALYLLLLYVVVPPAAAALAGVLILVIALLLIGVIRAATQPKRKREPMPAVEALESAAELGSELGRKVRGLTEAQASGGLMAALVAGFAFGVSPKLRSFLQSLLKA